MNNIEKFEQLKELYTLKSELHKMQLIETFEPKNNNPLSLLMDLIVVAKQGIHFVQQFKSNPSK